MLHHEIVNREAGLPSGVINFIPGSGSEIGDTILLNHDLGGFTLRDQLKPFNIYGKQLVTTLKTIDHTLESLERQAGKIFVLLTIQLTLTN